MDLIKLSLEQGELAFDILELMQEAFPENPELNIPVLQVLLYAIQDNAE